MKRIIDFAQALKAEISTALTNDVKKTICEDAKIVISLTMTGFWASLATHIVTDIEGTIK